ncbi:outer membrane protein, multidrug efflux system [Paracidovorax konjaci]|uniref:Outer membrane protein, multidrug efflux system n=2 Tax=Paracidovorax konjaci TaxID=32040 RepID=A0A1I1TRZ0_9BURK|nr:outer membrane protein, multidrug efflux system [Paracidovorax konjaci]
MSLPIVFLPERCLRSFVALASATSLLGMVGCASAPPDSMPKTSTVQAPKKWSGSSAEAGTLVESDWWKAFDSRELDALIEAALESNRDLQVLAARLAQARLLVDGAQAERRPQLGAVAGAQRGRDSSADPKTERSVAGFRASWEVDLFGKGGLAVEAAAADAQSVANALRAARIALTADVANAYFELRTLNARAVLGRDSAQLASRQVMVAKRKFDAGQSSALDVDRWEAELSQERASVTEIEGMMRIRQQQLAVLLGSSEAPTLTLKDAASVPAAPAPVMPTDLLERRPDVLRQARALDAALARVGVARRDVYPSLRIDWSGARERLAATGGSASPVSVVGYGISLTLPLLDGGRIRSNIAVQEARAQEAMAEYEKAMLLALADVEVALAQWTTSGAALQDWHRAQVSGEQAANRSERLFEAGVVDLGSVLDARRVHMRAQAAVIQAEGANFAAAVALRRAFAGGV